MQRTFALSIVLSCCFLLPGSKSVRAEDAPPAVAARPAASIKVALLPVVAGWSEGDETSRREKVNQGTEELIKLFADRGFVVIPADVVDRSIADQKLSFEEAGQRTSANLEKLGKSLGADWVVLVTVVGLKQERVKAPITDTDELVSTATMQSLVLDRSDGAMLMRGDSSACPVHSDPGSRKPRNIVGTAVREALRSLLAPFPIKRDRTD